MSACRAYVRVWGVWGVCVARYSGLSSNENGLLSSEAVVSTGLVDMVQSDRVAWYQLNIRKNHLVAQCTDLSIRLAQDKLDLAEILFVHAEPCADTILHVAKRLGLGTIIG